MITALTLRRRHPTVSHHAVWWGCMWWPHVGVHTGSRGHGGVVHLSAIRWLTTRARHTHRRHLAVGGSYWRSQSTNTHTYIHTYYIYIHIYVYFNWYVFDLYYTGIYLITALRALVLEMTDLVLKWRARVRVYCDSSVWPPWGATSFCFTSNLNQWKTKNMSVGIPNIPLFHYLLILMTVLFPLPLFCSSSASLPWCCVMCVQWRWSH